jgi:hypothetical protein
VPDFPQKRRTQTTIFFWIAPNIAKIKPLPALQGNAHRSSLQARLNRRRVTNCRSNQRHPHIRTYSNMLIGKKS